MKRFNNKNSVRNQRAPKGQALIETTVGLVALVAVFVGLLLLGLNVYLAAMLNAKAGVLATEVAKVLDAKKYWLGMERPDYNSEEAQHRAEELGVGIAHKLGLPTPTFGWHVESNDIADITEVSVHFTSVSPFGGGIFPTLIPINATGVSVHAKDEIYQVVDIGAPFDETGAYPVAAVPCFGFRDHHGRAIPPGTAPLGPFNPRHSLGLPLVAQTWATSSNPNTNYFNSQVQPNSQYYNDPNRRH